MKALNKVLILAISPIAAYGIYLAVIDINLAYGSHVTEKNFVEACEKSHINTLTSPSSYKRVKYNYKILPIERDEFFNYAREHYSAGQIGTQMSLFDSGLKSHEFLSVIFYDASNSFGAILRGVVYCNYTTRNKPYQKFSHILVDTKSIPEGDRRRRYF